MPQTYTKSKCHNQQVICDLCFFALQTRSTIFTNDRSNVTLTFWSELESCRPGQYTKNTPQVPQSTPKMPQKYTKSKCHNRQVICDLCVSRCNRKTQLSQMTGRLRHLLFGANLGCAGRASPARPGPGRAGMQKEKQIGQIWKIRQTPLGSPKRTLSEKVKLPKQYTKNTHKYPKVPPKCPKRTPKVSVTIDRSFVTYVFSRCKREAQLSRMTGRL